MSNTDVDVPVLLRVTVDADANAHVDVHVHVAVDTHVAEDIPTTLLSIGSSADTSFVQKIRKTIYAFLAASKDTSGHIRPHNTGLASGRHCRPSHTEEH